MAVAARSPRPLRFALPGQVPFLEIDRTEGLDLLEWLGVGRPEFGAIDASTLRPLCRRRLWAEARNLAPFVVGARTRDSATLRRLAIRVVNALEGAPDMLVHFG